MGRALRRAGVILAMGAACTSGPTDPAERAALHALLPGEAPGEGAPSAAPFEASQVVVDEGKLPGTRTGDETIRSWLLHGRDRATGELVAEVFLRLPQAIPTRPCLELSTSAGTVDAGRVLGGRNAFVPGATERPVIRHRLFLVDPGLRAPTTAGLSLVHCVTRTPLAPEVSVSLDAPRATVEGLRAWSGLPVADAAFAKPPETPAVLRRGLDGRMRSWPGPPLPRVERGTAWGLLILPGLDPSGWDVEGLFLDGQLAIGPLSSLRSMFGEAEGVVVQWDSPAAWGGEKVAAAGPSPRRTSPEALRPLPLLGVDALVLGPHGSDAGADGRRETLEHARTLGLLAGADGASLNVGEGEREVGVRVARPADGQSPSEAVAAARDAAPGALVVLMVSESAAAEAAASGADAVLVDHDGGPPRVRVVDGVPVVHPAPLSVSAREATAVRLYVSPEGVSRVDLVSLVRTGTTWGLDRDATLRDTLVEASRQAAEDDTWLAVGQTFAAVDAWAHFDRRRAEPAPVLDVESLEPAPLPTPVRPVRCAATGEPEEGTRLGRGLVLERAEILDGSVQAPGPARVRLTWRNDAGGPLPTGEVRWYGGGLAQPWRALHVPCDGSWGFERWSPGERLTEEVWLPVPEVAGKAELSLQVRLGGEPWTLADGERQVPVGTVTVTR